jgi:hypothetical protein
MEICLMELEIIWWQNGQQLRKSERIRDKDMIWYDMIYSQFATICKESDYSADINPWTQTFQSVILICGLIRLSNRENVRGYLRNQDFPAFWSRYDSNILDYRGVDKFATWSPSLDPIVGAFLRLRIQSVLGLGCCSWVVPSRWLSYWLSKPIVNLLDGCFYVMPVNGTTDGDPIPHAQRAQNESDSGRTSVSIWRRCLLINGGEEVAHALSTGEG